jgi:transcriptional regulator with XRE-family HTH domain
MGVDASQLLREARRRAGLSQAELARRGGTSQPTLSAYERGRKDPSAATLVRLLAAAGTTLTGAPGPTTTREFLRSRGGLPEGFRPETLADAARRVTLGEEFWFVLREFLDGIGLIAEVEGDAEVAALIAEEPLASGDRHVDVALAAVAEHLAARHGLTRPAWASEPQRFLDEWWFPHRRRAFDAMAVRDSPAAFRRRGIFLCPSMLERV